MGKINKIKKKPKSVDPNPKQKFLNGTTVAVGPVRFRLLAFCGKSLRYPFPQVPSQRWDGDVDGWSGSLEIRACKVCSSDYKTGGPPCIASGGGRDGLACRPGN